MSQSARRTIIRAATIIMLGNVVSRLLGLVREQVIRWHDGEPLENLVTDGY